jgi:hypothetical protein
MSQPTILYGNETWVVKNLVFGLYPSSIFFSLKKKFDDGYSPKTRFFKYFFKEKNLTIDTVQKQDSSNDFFYKEKKLTMDAVQKTRFFKCFFFKEKN